MLPAKRVVLQLTDFVQRLSDLLTTTPLTVVEVGRAAGFGDASTFFRAFRKEYGVTPAEYRANATKCN